MTMASVTQYTKEQIENILIEVGLPESAWETMNQWLVRGDGIAVYQNVEFGSPELGHRKFVSYGSTEAQLEVPEPPIRLPDIGAEINWRYHLEGTYMGAPLGESCPNCGRLVEPGSHVVWEPEPEEPGRFTCGGS